MNRRLEFFIVSILIIIISLLSFYPVYHRFQITPPDRAYVGTTFYTADYAGYVSNIEQGIKGRWTYVDKFTTEKLPETLLYYPYLIIGQVAGLLGINSIWAYHLSRLILGIIYLVGTFYLIKIIFPNSVIKRLFALILAIFASSFPSKISQMVAEVQVVNRFFIQPHYLLGNIFLILGIILFLKYLKKPLFKYVFFTGALVFLTAFFRPSHVMLYLGVLGIFAIFVGSCLPDRQAAGARVASRTTLAPSPASGFSVYAFTILVLLFSFPALFYLWFLNQNFPSLPYFLFDKETAAAFNLWDWILLGGPVLLLSFLSWRNLKKTTLVLWIFILVNLLFLFAVPKFYPLNPIRFLQTPYFVFLAILATEAIFRLSKKNIIIITIITVITITSSLPTLVFDFRREVNLYYDAYYIWPPKTYLPALSYLDKNTKPEEVVLTHSSLSNLVPMTSGNTVYWGHTNETLNYSQKQVIVEKFYKGLMSESEAEQFLLNNGIKYVLAGKEEKGLGKVNYGFLKKVFDNIEIAIYKVNLKFEI